VDEQSFKAVLRATRRDIYADCPGHDAARTPPSPSLGLTFDGRLHVADRQLQQPRPEPLIQSFDRWRDTLR
jgi:hypothetical protein